MKDEMEPLLDDKIVITESPVAVTISPMSREIEESDTDSESPSLPCCRICLERGSGGHALISPCLCKGTQQFVHRTCLDHWRSVKDGFAFSHCTTCQAQFHLRVEDFQDHTWRKIKFRFFVAKDIISIFLMIQMGIAAIGAIASLIDRNGNFRNSFSDDWELILSKHPIPFYYCVGVVVFLVGMGIYGLIWQCESSGNGSSTGNLTNGSSGSCNCCVIGADAGESAIIILVVLVVVLAIIGLFYSLFAATMAIQHVWQKHYHILTKRELTKEFVVEDLHGCYIPPKLEAKHEERLKELKLLQR